MTQKRSTAILIASLLFWGGASLHGSETETYFDDFEVHPPGDYSSFFSNEGRTWYPMDVVDRPNVTITDDGIAWNGDQALSINRIADDGDDNSARRVNARDATSELRGGNEDPHYFRMEARVWFGSEAIDGSENPEGTGGTLEMWFSSATYGAGVLGTRWGLRSGPNLSNPHIWYWSEGTFSTANVEWEPDTWYLMVTVLNEVDGTYGMELWDEEDNLLFSEYDVPYNQEFDTFTEINLYGSHADGSLYDQRFDDFRIVAMDEAPEPPVERTFATWRGEHFEGDDATDDGVSGPHVDLVGDGVNNLMRYALGLPPNVPARASLPEIGSRSIEVEGTEQSFLTLEFTRPDDISDVEYIVEATDDLSGSWEPLTDLAEEPVSVDSMTTYVYRDTVPIDEADRRMLRLRLLLDIPDIVPGDETFFDDFEVHPPGEYVSWFTNNSRTWYPLDVIHRPNVMIMDDGIAWSGNQSVSLNRIAADVEDGDETNTGRRLNTRDTVNDLRGEIEEPHYFRMEARVWFGSEPFDGSEDPNGTGGTLEMWFSSATYGAGVLGTRWGLRSGVNLEDPHIWYFSEGAATLVDVEWEPDTWYLMVTLLNEVDQTYGMELWDEDNNLLFSEYDVPYNQPFDTFTEINLYGSRASGDNGGSSYDQRFDDFRMFALDGPP